MTNDKMRNHPLEVKEQRTYKKKVTFNFTFYSGAI